jgi:hypothetical protein
MGRNAPFYFFSLYVAIFRKVTSRLIQDLLDIDKLALFGYPD